MRTVAVAVAVAVAMVLAVPALPPGPVPANEARVHGDAAEAASWAIDQPAKGLCGPTAVAMVAGRLLERPFGRREAGWAADRLGLLDYPLGGGVVGMRRSSLVDLFAAFGMDADAGRTTWNALRRHLDAGAGVILHVDSEELWHRGDGEADHFVVLTAIDDRHGIAFLNDPGMAPAYGFSPGTGAGHAVEIEELNEAWDDSGRWAVVASAASLRSA